MTKRSRNSLDFSGLSSRLISYASPGGLAVAIGAGAFAWALTVPLSTDPRFVEVGLVASSDAPPIGQKTARAFGDLSDAGFSEGPAAPAPPRPPLRVASLELETPEAEGPASLAGIPPLPPPRPAEAAPLPEPRPVEAAPLPPARPSELATPRNPDAPVRRQDSRSAKSSDPATPPDNRTFIQKLFGLGSPAPQSKSNLAYAAPETTSVSRSRSNLLGFLAPAPSSLTSRYDRYTAVYDLTAHVVYLPNGTRLEAHSGYGDRLDDPRHVNERNRGATPPNVYELEPREAIFHGVQALRLKPVGNGDVFGRAGLLAHSYMLGPNGDSNGCVSFKDYDAFLQAYQTGQVKRLAVVARLE
jgi:hypothetical protein